MLRYYTDPKYFSDEVAGRWLELLEARLAKAEALGSAYYHMVAPDKITIYPEHFPLPLTHAERAPSRIFSERAQSRSRLAEAYIDIGEPLARKKRDDVLFYWKTDTHWTFAGAYVAYEEIAARLNFGVDDRLRDAETTVAELILDLGSKLNPPVAECFEMHALQRRSRRIFANDLVQFKESQGYVNDAELHTGSHVVFANSQPLDDRVVVVFGDSYCEYRPHLLTGMLAETFKELHFIWSSNVDWGYVERVGADVVLTEVAERFVRVVPRDETNIEELAKSRLAHWYERQAQAQHRPIVHDPIKQFRLFRTRGAIFRDERRLAITVSREELNDAILSVIVDGQVKLHTIASQSTDWCHFASTSATTCTVSIALSSLAAGTIAAEHGTGAVCVVVLDRSKYPLCTFTPAEFLFGGATDDYLETLANNVESGLWGIDALFLENGRYYVSGWALPPEDASPGDLRVRIDEIDAVVTSSIGAARCAALLWFMPGVGQFGFVAEAPRTLQTTFAKIEVSFGEPFEAAARLPIYNYLGDVAALELPPDDNMRRVMGQPNAVAFYNSGMTDCHRLVGLARKCGLNIDRADVRILDWGCGCGRIARHLSALSPRLVLHGIDIDADNVRWCRENLPFGDFTTVGLLPPTHFRANSFDLVIANSVLTHLKIGVGRQWLQEICRVLAPNGLVLLSFNGTSASFLHNSTNPTSCATLEENGYSDDLLSPDLQSYIEDPDYYRSTFMTDQFALNFFGMYFDILMVEPSAVSGYESVAVLRKKPEEQR